MFKEKAIAALLFPYQTPEVLPQHLTVSASSTTG